MFYSIDCWGLPYCTRDSPRFFWSVLVSNNKFIKHLDFISLTRSDNEMKSLNSKHSPYRYDVTISIMMSYLHQKHVNFYFNSGLNYKNYKRKMSLETFPTEYIECKDNVFSISFSYLKILINSYILIWKRVLNEWPISILWILHWNSFNWKVVKHKSSLLEYNL